MQEYHEDPMVLANALRLSLQAGVGEEQNQSAPSMPSLWQLPANVGCLW